MTDLLLDTNILLAAATGRHVYESFKEVYPELRLATLDRVIQELETLMKKPGNLGKQAILAKALVDKQDLYIVSQSSKYVDKALITIASELGAWIATLDRQVQQAGRDAKITVLTLLKGGQVMRVH